jgi:glucose-6-phosphate 1-epimerase
MTDTASSFSVELSQWHGVPAWVIESDRARAVISPQGGQLLSWQPQGQSEVFWLSPNTRSAPSAIRGGVPVCWPYFGKQGQPADAVQHGHARLHGWHWVDAVEADDGAVVVDLALPADPSTPLRLRQRLRIGAELSQTLITDNAGDQTIELTQALHSYFAVGDAMQVELRGVAGLAYADKLDGGHYTQAGDWRLDEARDPGRCDRIYATAGGAFVLHDPVLGRRIELQTEGSRTVVVWNPGASGAAAMADMPDAAWREFVCVEVANAADDVIRLAAGDQHRLSQRLRLLPAA